MSDKDVSVGEETSKNILRYNFRKRSVTSYSLAKRFKKKTSSHLFHNIKTVIKTEFDDGSYDLSLNSSNNESDRPLLMVEYDSVEPTGSDSFTSDFVGENSKSVYSVENTGQTIKREVNRLFVPNTSNNVNQIHLNVLYSSKDNNDLHLNDFADESSKPTHSACERDNTLIEMNIKKEIIEEGQVQNVEIVGEPVVEDLIINIKKEPLSPIRDSYTTSETRENIQKEIIEEGQVQNVEIVGEPVVEDVIINIKKEPLSRIRDSYTTSETRENIQKEIIEEEKVQNVGIVGKPEVEDLIVNIKKEPLSPIRDSYTTSETRAAIESSETLAGSSLVIKKELLDVNCVFGNGHKDKNLQKRTKCPVRQQENYVKRTTKETKRGCKAVRERKIKEEMLFSVPSTSNKENLCDTDSNSTPPDKKSPPVKYNMKFINPFCVLKKKVLIKQEELSEEEKEKIELDKDKRCREITRKTGQAWRRTPVHDEPSDNITIEKMPDVIVVFTPAGQRCELYPNFDRPDEFPTEEDRKQWDTATLINISRNVWDIENGNFIPLGVDEQKEKRMQNFVNKADEVYNKMSLPKSDLWFLTAESMFLKLDCWINTCLPEKEIEISGLMNDVMAFTFHRFLFIKYPQILQTLMRMMEQDQYEILKYKASLLYRKIQLSFRIPDCMEFESCVYEMAQMFRNSCGDMSIIQYAAITPWSVAQYALPTTEDAVITAKHV